MTMPCSWTVAFAAALLFVVAFPRAQTHVLPDGAAAATVNSTSSYPWNRRTSPIRVQYVYDSSHFTNVGITAPILVQRLRWRASDSTTTTWTGGVYQNVIVEMSTAAVDHTAVSTTFASNHGPDRTVVHTGTVTVLPGTGTGSGVPGPYYVDLTLAVPFAYDPSSGSDLVFDLQVDGTWVGNGGTETTTMAVASGTAAMPPALTSRVYNLSNWQSATGSTQQNVAPALEVTYLPAMGMFANFDATPRFGSAPLAVQFTDRSLTSASGGIIGWAWDFDGDGTIDSNAQNPLHTYPNGGSYTVSLTTLDGANPPATETKTDYIEIDIVEADFAANVTFGPTPLLVQFTDLSVNNPTAWAWDFDGDGVVDSTMQSPLWGYGLPGTYSVSLTASNAFSSDTETKMDLIVAVGPTVNSMSADTIEYQFNEPRGTAVVNAASTTLAPPFGTVNSTGWQSDPGRTRFGANEPGFGALGASGATNTNLVASGWPLDVAGDMTIMWWQRTSAPPGSSLAYVFGGAGGQFRAFTGGFAGNALAYRGSSIGDVLGTYDVQASLNTWDHLALVVDDQAGIASWYANGVLDTQTMFTAGSHTATNTDFHIGYHTSTTSTYTRYYELDDFRLYQRALSTAEIQAAMGGENPTATAFGAGCSGPTVVPQISGTALPQLGNTNFGLQLDRAEPNRPCVVVAGALVDGNGTVPIDISAFVGPGCQLEIVPEASAATTTGPGGFAIQGLPIPNIPSLAGAHAYAQWIVLGTQGAASPALDLNLQP